MDSRRAWLVGLSIFVGCQRAAEEAPDISSVFSSVLFLAPDSVIHSFPSDDVAVLERSLALDVSDSSIAVGDISAGKVYRFSRDGALRAVAGGKGEGPGELLLPISVRLGNDESLWVSDTRNMRVTHYEASGQLISTFRVPGAGDQMVPIDDDGVLTPSSFGALLNLFHADGTFETISDSAAWPAPLIHLQGIERVGMRSLLLARLNEETIFLLHNVPDFSSWKFQIDFDERRLASSESLSLPEWFETSVRSRLSKMQESLHKDGIILVPFNAIHTPVPGTIWLTTGPLGSMIGAQLPLDSEEGSIAVIATNGEKEGLLDAVLLKDRLVALYETGVRVYGLKEVEAPDRLW